VVTIFSMVELAADGGEGLVDGDQGAAQAPGLQHHHRAARAVDAVRGGQFGQELGMARKLEAGGVERRLGDRGGDQAADRAGEGQAGAGLDPADDLGGVGARRLAGDDARLQRHVEHGQGVGEDRRAPVSGAVTLRRLIWPPPGAPVSDWASPTTTKAGPLVAQRRPGLDHDLGADPGGITQAER
jgi:hypothetical protein